MKPFLNQTEQYSEYVMGIYVNCNGIECRLFAVDKLPASIFQVKTNSVLAEKAISEIKFKLGVYCFVMFEKFTNGGGLIDCLATNKKRGSG